MAPPKKPLFKVNKKAFVDSTLTANKEKDWVKRLYQQDTPKLQLPNEPFPSTHLMGDDGNGYVFPTLVQLQKGKLTNLGRDAEAYARETNTGIQFKNKEQGDFFGHNGYKQGTGVLQEFTMGTKKIKKAANGLQRIQADAATNRSLIGTGISAGAEALAPGIGGTVIGGLEAFSSTLKDKNGLYTNKANQVLDGLNPITQVSRLGKGIGQLFSGKTLDIDGQQEIKDALERKKVADMQEENWGKVGMDTRSMSQMGQYKEGAKKIAKPSQIAAQDNTSPRNMYKGNPGSGEGGAKQLKRTARGAAAALSLTKAIPTPFTQAVGWGASGVSALMDGQDAYNSAARGNYKDAAISAGQAALSLVPLNTKALTVTNKLSNSGVRMAKSAALLADGSDIKDAMYKDGAKGVATKPIEMEGEEAHFSKKVNGKRQLKTYDPQGAKHTTGGMKVLAAEGDAIVTASGDQGHKAVAAHMRGDYKAVEKIINKMPVDKGKKKAKDGLEKIKFKAGQVLPPDIFKETSPSDSFDSRMAAIGHPMRTDIVPDGVMPKDAPKPLTLSQKLEGPMKGITNAAQAAPTIFNLGQGLFGNVEKVNRRGYTPTLNTYEDMSAPQRVASNQAMNGQVSNARNLSGGNAGNLRANASQAYADNYTRLGVINNQEVARKMGVNESNVSLTNNAKLQNNAMNDQADNIDALREAKKGEFLAKGLEGIGGLASKSILEGNQRQRDADSMASLGQMYKNYELVDGKWVMKKLKKGVKALK